MKPTTDDVLKWARKAGVDLHPAHGILVLRHSNGSWIGVDDVVEILAALAYAAGAADMKEQCAKVCDGIDPFGGGARKCAAAIRARGETK